MSTEEKNVEQKVCEKINKICEKTKKSHTFKTIKELQHIWKKNELDLTPFERAIKSLKEWTCEQVKEHEICKEDGSLMNFLDVDMPDATDSNKPNTSSDIAQNQENKPTNTNKPNVPRKAVRIPRNSNLKQP